MVVLSLLLLLPLLLLSLLLPLLLLSLLPLSLSSPPELKTMKLALEPFSTVTTQKAPPPAPSVALPTISFTLF
jgi:hypothetical protein